MEQNSGGFGEKVKNFFNVKVKWFFSDKVRTLYFSALVLQFLVAVMKFVPMFAYGDETIALFTLPGFNILLFIGLGLFLLSSKNLLNYFNKNALDRYKGFGFAIFMTIWFIIEFFGYYGLVQATGMLEGLFLFSSSDELRITFGGVLYILFLVALFLVLLILTPIAKRERSEAIVQKRLLEISAQKQGEQAKIPNESDSEEQREA